MPSNEINKQVVSMIRVMDELRELQIHYSDMQVVWSSALKSSINKLLNNKRENLGDSSINWGEETAESLIERYNATRRVLNGLRVKGKYKSMEKVRAQTMVVQFDFATVRAEISSKEENLKSYSEHLLTPGLKKYKESVGNLRMALLESFSKADLVMGNGEMLVSTLSFLSVLSDNLIGSTKSTLSVDKILKKSIAVNKSLGGDVITTFKEMLVAKMGRILLKTKTKDIASSFKFVTVNASTPIHIVRASDMQGVLDDARYQEYLIKNKASIVAGELTIKELIKDFPTLGNGLQEINLNDKGDEETEENMKYKEYSKIFEELELIRQRSREIIKTSQYISSITEKEENYASQESEEYEDWVKSNEEEVLSPILEEI